MTFTLIKEYWKALVSRAVGAFLLTARLQAAVTSGPDYPISSIFDPHSTPADAIKRLSDLVLSVTGIIFVIVFTLLLYAVIKFRRKTTLLPTVNRPRFMAARRLSSPGP